MCRSDAQNPPARFPLGSQKPSLYPPGAGRGSEPPQREDLGHSKATPLPSVFLVSLPGSSVRIKTRISRHTGKVSNVKSRYKNSNRQKRLRGNRKLCEKKANLYSKNINRRKVRYCDRNKRGSSRGQGSCQLNRCES